MSGLFEIPKDVMLDLSKIVLVGDLQVFIENHRGILEYSLELVRINLKDYEVVVKGENLQLKNVGLEEICVEGKIKVVLFNK